MFNRQAVWYRYGIGGDRLKNLHHKYQTDLYGNLYRVGRFRFQVGHRQRKPPDPHPFRSDQRLLLGNSYAFMEYDRRDELFFGQIRAGYIRSRNLQLADRKRNGVGIFRFQELRNGPKRRTCIRDDLYRPRGFNQEISYD